MRLLDLQSLVPDGKVRYVGSHQYERQDIATMVPHASNRQRIGSSIVDAFGALMQRESPGASFLVLSSWLARVVAKVDTEEETRTKDVIRLVESAVRTRLSSYIPSFILNEA